MRRELLQGLLRPLFRPLGASSSLPAAPVLKSSSLQGLLEGIEGLVVPGSRPQRRLLRCCCFCCRRHCRLEGPDRLRVLVFELLPQDFVGLLLHHATEVKASRGSGGRGSE